MRQCRRADGRRYVALASTVFPFCIRGKAGLEVRVASQVTPDGGGIRSAFGVDSTAPSVLSYAAAACGGGPLTHFATGYSRLAKLVTKPTPVVTLTGSPCPRLYAGSDGGAVAPQEGLSRTRLKRT